MKKILNTKYKILNTKGFTLIELVVSLAVITILISLFLANYRNGSRGTELNLAAETLATDIRSAQDSTMGVEQYNGVVPKGGWGVHFDKTVSAYTLFADLNADKTFNSGGANDEGNVGYGARVFTLPANVTIDSISLKNNNNYVSANKVDITFVPPDPITNIYNSDSSATSTDVIIVLKDGISQSTKSISVNFFGLIQVVN